jgi:NAD(P)-dependent dehydrogenase (short-subunit alcohol dehydrogenase family)
MHIDGVAAVVTGGSSGLGAATCRELASAGARVAVFDVNEAAGADVAAEVGGLFQTCDVGDEASAMAAFEAAEAAHGAARILVNCAGIGPMARLFRRSGLHTIELFEQVMRVNATGTFNCVRLAAAGMAKLEPTDSGDRGVIVNTASVAGLEGTQGAVAYSASKAAVAGMTLPLARELAEHDIRVVAIAPGAFDTPMYGSIDAEATERMLTDVLSPKRLGRPEEYAKFVRHVVENQMLNGEVIRLDAGIRMAARYA